MSRFRKLQLSMPWIGKPWMDTVFILFPPFGCLLFIALFPGLFADSKEVPDTWWVILILLIDVAHVYSTLYRTYFDKVAFKEQKNLLTAIPFIGYIAGVLLFNLSSVWFWRVLAYVAVFHFIRQQYGFMRVYSRKEQISQCNKMIDKFVIYYATIYPLIYWHLGAPRNFNWFMEGDFYFLESARALTAATIIFYLVLGIYIIKEVQLTWSIRQFNVPRISVITGTILSWYFGIVYFNGDLAFTLLNVVSHGIPYMALVYIYGNKNRNTRSGEHGTILKWIFSRYGIVLFLALVFLFAYVEEGLWDTLVWKDHQSLFAGFYVANFEVSHQVLSFVVPLLALPQITHYIIDGFIWRIRHDKFKWNNEIVNSPAPVQTN